MLDIQHITKAFEKQPVLRGVSMALEPGEIACLLGPSGCGKTTLLRIVAGLEKADSGRVCFDGADLAGVPAHRRGFGLMFQDFALFPHLDVAGNVAFGLQMQKLRRPEIMARVEEALARVRLAGFERRSVTSLSGGEQQRVALARSLAPQPRLLMLDEPLGSLDAALREQLVLELRDILKAAGLIALYVTHDQQEAFAIADRVGVMLAGRIEQIDTPAELYHRPQTEAIARFLGLNNLLSVTRLDDLGGRFCAHTALGVFELPSPAQKVLLHPAALSLLPAGQGIPMVVERCIFRGASVQVHLRHASGLRLILSVADGATPAVGESVGLGVASVLGVL